MNHRDSPAILSATQHISSLVREDPSDVHDPTDVRLIYPQLPLLCYPNIKSPEASFCH